MRGEIDRASAVARTIVTKFTVRRARDRCGADDVARTCMERPNAVVRWSATMSGVSRTDLTIPASALREVRFGLVPSSSGRSDVRALDQLSKLLGPLWSLKRFD